MARRRGPLKPMARGRALVSYPLALGCRFIWSVLLLGRERRPRKRFTYYMLIGELGRTSDLVLEPSTGRVADGRWTRCSRVRGPRAAAGEGLRAHEARRQRPPASAASRCRPRTRRRRPVPRRRCRRRPTARGRCRPAAPAARQATRARPSACLAAARPQAPSTASHRPSAAAAKARAAPTRSTPSPPSRSRSVQSARRRRPLQAPFSPAPGAGALLRTCWLDFPAKFPCLCRINVSSPHRH